MQIYQNQAKIGVFVENLTHLFLKEAVPEANFFYFFEQNPRIQKWLASFLPKEKLLAFKFKKKSQYLNDYFDNSGYEGILYNSNLSDVIRKNGIHYFVLGLVCTKYLFEWASRNKITLVSTDYRFQKNFENKLYFDNFLEKNRLPKPKSAIFNYSRSKALPFKEKFVVQNPYSFGGNKTFFVRSPEEMEQLVKENEIKPKADYLVRQFIPGKTYGITVFIAPNMIALSSARLQCFADSQASMKRKLIGIQFMGNSFNQKLVKEINRVFLKIGRLLYRRRFFGLANFDFIIDPKNNIYFVECNPRISAATPHLIKFPELISNIPISRIFLEYYFEKKPYGIKPVVYGYPSTSFNGSVLDICVFPEKLGREVKIAKIYQNGLYSFQNNKFSFRNADLGKIESSQKQLAFLTTVKIGETFQKSAIIANTLSNFPLFNTNGEVNKNGQRVLETFRF